MNLGYLSPSMSGGNGDTIAAIATAPGEGAIAIVRVSGPASLQIADRVCRCGGPPPSRRPASSFIHGRITEQGGSVIDDVLLLLFHGPSSYTGEDAVEIQGHGGTVSAKRILRTVLDAGARLAEPGEFTKRAFLNGRIDLLQAEAVLDLIRARSDRAAQSAVEQLDGDLSRSFDDIYDTIMVAASELEATLDFSDDDLPVGALAGIREHLSEGERKLRQLLATWDEGHVLREGAVVVITGKPNVGKSTLFNVLLGAQRAIVTPIPGTTRDTIEEQVVIDGFPVRIVDTAGIRATDCDIEGEGIRRARAALQQADVTIYMLDGSALWDTDDIRSMESLPQKKTIIVVNKTDLAQEESISSYMGTRSYIRMSLTDGIGIQALRSAIVDKLVRHIGVGHHAAISERHRALTAFALRELVDASLLFNRELPEHALTASRLRVCLEHIGEITGRVYQEDMLDTIFSKFCIGK